VNVTTRIDRRLDLRVVVALVASLAAGVVLLGLAVRGGGTPAIDLSLPGAIMAWYPPAATDLFDTLGTLPVFGAVMVLGAIGSLATGRRDMTVAFVLGLFGEIPSTLVKLAIDRPRPPASTEIEAFLTAASYPSGHTVRAVLMAGLIVAAVAWTGRSGAVRFVAALVGTAFVALVGLARIASGQHWPTDVLGGLLLGVASLTICLVAAGRVRDRSGRPRSPPAAA
jgi:membrane-associated phospholipid phosphatase